MKVALAAQFLGITTVTAILAPEQVFVDQLCRIETLHRPPSRDKIVERFKEKVTNSEV